MTVVNSSTYTLGKDRIPAPLSKIFKGFFIPFWNIFSCSFSLYYFFSPPSFLIFPQAVPLPPPPNNFCIIYPGLQKNTGKVLPNVINGCLEKYYNSIDVNSSTYTIGMDRIADFFGVVHCPDAYYRDIIVNSSTCTLSVLYGNIHYIIR